MKIDFSIILRERERKKVREREKESEREIMSGVGQKERGRERIPNRLCIVSTETASRLELTNSQDHDLSRSQESDRHLTN